MQNSIRKQFQRRTDIGVLVNIYTVYIITCNLEFMLSYSFFIKIKAQQSIGFCVVFCLCFFVFGFFSMWKLSCHFFKNIPG